MKVGIFVPKDGGISASSPASVASIRQVVAEAAAAMMEQKGGAEAAAATTEVSLVVDFTTSDLEDSMRDCGGITVFVLPGGEPQKMKNALTPAAYRTLLDWTQNQGVGLIGICAGSVVACKRKKGTPLVEGISLVNDNRFGHTGLSSMVPLKLQKLPSELQAYLSRRTKTPVNDAVSGVECSMPYISGPLFALEKKKESSSSTRTMNAAILATYATDATSGLLPITQDGDNMVSSASNKSSWTYSLCGKVHSSQNNKVKTCCGMKKSEHVKQMKLLGQLAGVMPGKGAVAAVDNGAFRSVLFGPHPEMGDEFCRHFLVACMQWVSQPRL